MAQDAKGLSAPKVLVSEIMTAGVHRARPEMKVCDAIELLIKYRISGAPLVDQMDQVLSAVSEGDLLRLAASDGLDANLSHCLSKLPKANELITLQPDQSFTDAYRLFLKHSLHRLIVVDGNGRLKGLVSRADILRMFVEARYGRPIRRTG